MKIRVRDLKRKRVFELKVYPENTPQDVLSVLIEEGYIPTAPGDNPQYFWVLAHANAQLDPDVPLVQQGVTDGAELDLLPVPVPGGGPIELLAPVSSFAVSVLSSIVAKYIYNKYIKGKRRRNVSLSHVIREVEEWEKAAGKLGPKILKALADRGGEATLNELALDLNVSHYELINALLRLTNIGKIQLIIVTDLSRLV